MVPIRALAEAKLVQGPQTVVRYNGFRGAIVNGAPKPGYSSGQALAAMERISAATLPAGYSFEWTGTALQEKAASGRTAIVLGFAVLFAFFSSRFTRAGTFRFPLYCRSASGYSAPSSR